MLKNRLVITLLVCLLTVCLIFPIGTMAFAAQPQDTLPPVWLVNAKDGDIYTFFKQTDEKALYGDFSAKYIKKGLIAGQHVLDRPVDLSAYKDNGYLHLVFYVENAEDFTGYAYIELSSSGVVDSKEQQYDFQGNIQAGWNHLTFPLSSGYSSRPSIDWSKVNFSRLVIQNAGTTPIWVEGAYVSLFSGEESPYEGFVDPQLTVEATCANDVVTLTVEAQATGAMCAVHYDKLMLEATGNTEKTLSADGTTFTFRAREGGCALFRVDLTLADGRIVSAFARTTVQKAGYYYGDGHTHTILSDGEDTLLENFLSAYRRGSSFIFTADHNYDVTKTEPIKEALSSVYASTGSSANDFLAITANEITGTKGHSLQYFSSRSFSPTTTAAGYQTLIRDIKADGGLYFLAHPFITSRFYFPDLDSPSVVRDEYKDVDGFEIVNGVYGYTSYNQQAMELWDRYNITGYKHYYAIGNTDAHNAGWVALTKNHLYLSSLSETNIRQAYENGNFYVSDGADLRFTLGGKSMGEELAVAASDTDASLDLKAYNRNGYAVEKVVVYKYTMGDDIDAAYAKGQSEALVLTPSASTDFYEYTGSLRISPGDFVRVAVFSESGQAYSNPIWVVKASADSSKLDGTSEVTDNPKSGVGLFEQIWLYVILAVTVFVGFNVFVLLRKHRKD